MTAGSRRLPEFPHWHHVPHGLICCSSWARLVSEEGPEFPIQGVAADLEERSSDRGLLGLPVDDQLLQKHGSSDGTCREHHLLVSGPGQMLAKKSRNDGREHECCTDQPRSCHVKGTSMDKEHEQQCRCD